jgi:hypothetical protein
MNKRVKTTSIGIGRKLGLVTSVITLVGSFSIMAANYSIVNETYDPPSMTEPGGWHDGAVTFSYQYVNEGVGGSTAIQTSLVPPTGSAYWDVATCLFQSGVMGGNEWATRANTVLSFDIKVDRPGLAYVGIDLDAFTQYDWNGTYSGAFIPVALGSYKPGVFQRIVLRLDDPNWQQITEYPSPDLAPWFDPSSRTYNNIALLVGTGSFVAAPPDSLTITMDNVQVTTKNDMIPFAGTGKGTVKLGADGYIMTEQGVAEHLGSYKLTAAVPYDGSPGTTEITAANGEKLTGSWIFGAENDVGVQFGGDSKRFAGVVGSYRGVYALGEPLDDTTFPYTVKLTGGISSVGSNK